MGSLQPLTTSSSPKTDGRFRSGDAPSNKSDSYRPDLAGKRFGWVEVISPEVRWLGARKDKDGYPNRSRHLRVRCTGCSESKWIDMRNLLRGATKGCQACSQPRKVPHWLERRAGAMRYRCLSPKAKSWPRYGGRGIEFRFSSALECALWVQENLGLDKAKELDRIDNNGHYEAGNLRYATKSQNLRNQARSRMTETDAVWAQKSSPFSSFTTEKYLRLGYPKEAIIGIAFKAVLDKRKNWRGIKARLESLGFMTS